MGPAPLFCPGDRPERYAKAVAVIFDLEEAVAVLAATADQPGVFRFRGKMVDARAGLRAWA
jgi:citrate lyase subunit beta/citryl-CoA lyase